MNLFYALMELDKLNEGLSRDEMISRLRAFGKNYNFSRFPDRQLYGMLRDAEAKKERERKSTPKPIDNEFDLDFESPEEYKCCDFCGTGLTDFDQCPVCDLGEENITEAVMSKFANNIDKDIISGLNSSVPEEPVLGGMIKCSKSAPLNALYYISKGENVEFKLGNIRLPLSQITHCWIEHNGEVAQTRNDMPDSDLKTKFSVKLVPNDIDKSKKLIIDLVNSINGTNESLDEWVDASGKRVSIPNSSAVNTSTQTVSQQQRVPAPHLPSGRYAVRIVDDHGRLRAEGTDGVNPIAWVAFPNHLRQFEGQQYEVDQLIWNGKNYRVSGNIVEI